MPPRGLTARTMGRYAGRYLINRVTVWRMSGKVKGIDQWEQLGVFNGLLIEKGSTYLGTDNAKQVYTSTVIIRAGIRFSLPNERYRVHVDVLKSRWMKDDPDAPEPELSFSRELMPVMVDTYPDTEGTEFLHLMRCQNGDRDQSDTSV